MAEWAQQVGSLREICTTLLVLCRGSLRLGGCQCEFSGDESWVKFFYKKEEKRNK